MLSAENAVQSSQTSSGLIEKIADTFVSSYKEMPVEEKKQFVSSLQDVVRKAAHFAVFAVLGVSVSCFASTFKGRIWAKVIFCQLFCCLYAVSDEFHQKFSEGRSCQLSDILFDSVGSFCGIVFILFSVFLFVKIRSKGGNVMRKRDLLKRAESFEKKLMEADAYIKELTDLIADKDEEIRRLNTQLSSQRLCEEESDNVHILSEQAVLAEEVNNEPTEEAVAISSDYHDFDFAESAVPENGDDLNTYAVKAIGRIVTESVKIGCVLASSDNENKKELLNLALGRTEVAKNEISALVTAELESDLAKASIDKECALVMEYYQSILAQL